MSDPFIGQITMFGGNFAPRGWGFCDGQLLAISQNTALFSILGTTYGGDGVTTFALPDLRGRVSIHPGQGPGLSRYTLGEKGGAETVTLTANQIPSHSHQLNINSSNGNTSNGTDAVVAGYGTSAPPVGNFTNAAANASASSSSISNTGGSQSHNNLQPFLCVNFIIALVGIYPSRS